ncbi:MAG: UDP-2,3-diacylglucosamine diphosphatase [Gammaproteobacteria bacterium]|nr:UDP-2,3-diacylglucosamine diphosphatase [Gammaproteobacteria bacterium]
MSRVFISDLHLESEQTPKYRSFQRVLRNACENGEEVFVLGDLVDVWIGDDDDSSFARQLISDLRSCAAQISLHVMHGNRDFLYREKFANLTGAVLLTDPYVLARDDLPERILLSHGDAYCTSDSAYMQMRNLFRSSEWQNQILGSTLVERRELARSLREQSKASNELKAENITDVVEIEIEKDLLQHYCTTMIHGHTHRPGIHALGNGMKRMVLGDWDRCGWLLRQHASAFNLERFAVQSH